mmetsp:Transcript_17020/g.41136  ORF Transcript_17020/g.41136 Transcript_17020/m.41136 type:complete len:89 (+) Transcript_17020:40-306(+)
MCPPCNIDVLYHLSLLCPHSVSSRSVLASAPLVCVSLSIVVCGSSLHALVFVCVYSFSTISLLFLFSLLVLSSLSHSFSLSFLSVLSL